MVCLDRRRALAGRRHPRFGWTLNWEEKSSCVIPRPRLIPLSPLLGCCCCCLPSLPIHAALPTLTRLQRILPGPSSPIGREEFALPLDDSSHLIVRAVAPKPTGVLVPTTLTPAEMEEKELFAGISVSSLSVDLSDVMALGAGDISCVGCRACLDTLLDSMRHDSLSPPPTALAVQGSRVRLRAESLPDGDSAFRIFNTCRRRIVQMLERLPRSKHKTRCGLHSTTCSHDSSGGCSALRFGDTDCTSFCQWKQLFESSAPQFLDDLLRIPRAEFRGELQTFMRRHKFCLKCQARIGSAFALLFGDSDPRDLPDCDLSLYDDLALDYDGETGEQLLVLPQDMYFLSGLTARARALGQGGEGGSEERHAKTVAVGQREVLGCLGELVQRRVEAVLARHRAHMTCLNLLPLVIALALRNSALHALHSLRSEQQASALLLSLEKKKRRKRQQQKKSLPCAQHVTSCERHTASTADDECARCELLEEEQADCRDCSFFSPAHTISPARSPSPPASRERSEVATECASTASCESLDSGVWEESGVAGGRRTRRPRPGVTHRRQASPRVPGPAVEGVAPPPACRVQFPPLAPSPPAEGEDSTECTESTDDAAAPLECVTDEAAGVDGCVSEVSGWRRRWPHRPDVGPSVSVMEMFDGICSAGSSRNFYNACHGLTEGEVQTFRMRHPSIQRERARVRADITAQFHRLFPGTR